MPSEQDRLKVDVQRQACPYCRDGVAPDQQKVACDACMAWHHAECWASHGACSTCGSATISGGGAAPAPVAPPVRRAPGATRRLPDRSCERLDCREPAFENRSGIRYCRSHLRENLVTYAKAVRQAGSVPSVLALAVLVFAVAVTNVRLSTEWPILLVVACMMAVPGVLGILSARVATRRAAALGDLPPTSAPKASPWKAQD